MNVSDVLKQASSSKKRATATDMVEIPVPPELLVKHAMKYEAHKSAKADLALSEEELLNEVKPRYIEAVKKNYVNSARLRAGDVEATVSWKDAYKKIPIEKRADIENIVGDKYHDFFQEINDIHVKSDIAADPKALEELIEAIGPDNFSKYFDVEQVIKPTSRFTQERYRSLTEEVNQDLQTVGVQQHSPAIRVKS